MPSSPDGERGTLTLWTQQAPVVLEALERDGVYRVRRSYVTGKYGDAAWSFEIAYGFFAREAARLVPPPAGAQSPVWCYVDRRWASSGTDGALLELEVPRAEAVLFDLRAWNRVLNLDYLPLDEGDGRRFEGLLRSRGLSAPSEAFRTPMHPLERREIEASWGRLLSSARGCDPAYLQAGIWEIRAEWVRGERGFSGAGAGARRPAG